MHGGDNPGQVAVNLEKELAGNEIVGKIDFKMDSISEVQLAENLRKAGEWARGIAVDKKRKRIFIVPLYNLLGFHG